MKWKNRYQLLAFLFYLCAFNCFCLALFFPLLVQSLSDNINYTVGLCRLTPDAIYIDTSDRKKKIPDSPKPETRDVPAAKRIDNTGAYDITITQE